ncbi:MAG TPA: AMP-binding protein [Candidatus Limnocylindria bacterium]|nr:AMP-binding protein [Candidatus Limnocylindria bacterium]
MSGQRAAVGQPHPVDRELRPGSLVDLLHRSVQRWPEHEALRWKVAPGSAADGSRWASWSYAQLWHRVRAVSLGLQRIGLAGGDRVAIMSRSRPEWLVADLASLALGAVTCPIQPGEPPERLAALMRHLAPRLVFVENDHLLERLRRAAGAELVASVVLFDPSASPDSPGTTLDEVAASAEGSSGAAAWEAGWVALDPARVATIVHTMAEDGVPRGAVLTHANVIHSALAATEAIPLSPADTILSVLPLSHMFERGANVMASLGAGATVVFADRSMERWAADLAQVRPTVMCCVPLFFEQLERRIRGQVAASPGVARALFGWAWRVGDRSDRLREQGRPIPVWLRVTNAAARRTILAPVHGALGGRLRFFVSGGAPLAEATSRFFAGAGVTILEGYGLTETAPLLTVNRYGSQRHGTVGRPVVETEIRIAPETDEVLARGPQVMSGYLDLPDLNSVLLDPNGWFHTGDRGSLDADGFLRITGRIKNLIVLSTGKKVAPAPIEEAVAASSLVAQAVLLGDRQDGVGLLVYPVPGLDGGLPGEAARLHREVERLTAPFAAHERPRRLGLLPRALSLESGELDEAGRPRRDAIVAHFPAEVAALFGGGFGRLSGPDQPVGLGSETRSSSSQPEQR